MSGKKVILAGYSGHGLVVAEAAILSGINIQYYSEFNRLDKNPFSLEYIGFEGDEKFEGWGEDFDFILGIGDNFIRQKVADLILSRKKMAINVIHPGASCSANVLIGSGNFIARNASINPMVNIGNNCIINTGSIIEHECCISDAVHIAPGAVLAGNVSVGENSFIGANAVVKQGITIGKNVVVGAGTVIIKNIPDNKKIVGNPSREI